ncbi:MULTISPECIES: M1 family metallopeptidase [Idiomarinaceae]|uniref:M1 family metallopeptidase n=1 Tax=Pseudidiomarina fusca TaxID=2965078 RepID=A0ABU3KZ59_9GAMM|nr:MULTISPECIES: M1 family metallopeptidase [Idiomarinaceae]MDT7526612.1 M1 family metallopeptidase [Pseudidiomarina sp. GXY010]MRJ42075.1 aminopeptidase [Idiomarina sp. FeN1]NCU57000.1 aminopeptidase [Idiomarina sp. FenA--70]NCU59709.1 aminopeptidase [Idiomarina sp. FenBw--71]UUN13297.1 M1 family metallopeptidase [Idiomarina loihiensis]
MKSTLYWCSALALAATQLFSTAAYSSAIQQTKGTFEDKFRQLDEVLPTPNVYRSAAGEPGEQYWQQQANYSIKVRLDEEKRRIDAAETITYFNNSPYTLKYIWIQLDQNIFKNDSMAELTATFNSKPDPSLGGVDRPARISLNQLRRQQFMTDNELGFAINKVADGRGKALDFVVVGTNMRIDLPQPLKAGDKTSLAIDFGFNIIDSDTVGGRSGYEHFPDDAREGGNDIFLLAQWYPRVAAFTDYEAWTNKEFLGRGEFTQEFGDFEVTIDVPADHIVSATGVLKNDREVLTKTQRERLEQSRKAKRPVFVVTPEEALENEKEGTDKRKVWRFEAENVRDFAWASSRKFIWDAKGYQQGGNVQPEVMAMSFYPKEGGELWEKYSTESVIHTMEVYSRFSFDYPYPTAQSVNGPVGGMEYPMITFNGPRTILQDDGSRTYSLSEKRFLIGVVIHEIGHIYFPMIVNSDERQWTWMDEGLNSFLDGVAGREWDPTIPWGVEPRSIVDYMKSTNQVPIMTQSDSVLNLGPNAYTKPAAALNILREVILGRELFDFAFKEYAQRWAFKRPTPADFFRTMEEASGVDLDWFWRGWFYSTDHVDIALDRVYKLRLDTQDPDIDWERRRQEETDKPTSLFVQRNQAEGRKTWVELNPDVRDFHDENDRFTVTNKQRNAYQSFLEKLEPWERKTFDRAIAEDKNYYVLDFNNLGGLVMPILLQWTYTDGSQDSMYIPAEIWRRNAKSVSKLIVTDKEVLEFAVDPNWETADVDIENNYYPRKIIPSRIEAFKATRGQDHISRDIMQDAKTKLKTKEANEEEQD